MDVKLLQTQITGIEEFRYTEDAVQLYPNPIDKGEAMTLKCPNSERLRVRFFDLGGKLIGDSFHEGRTKYSIRIPGEGSGILFYQIESEQFIKNGKLVVN